MCGGQRTACGSQVSPSTTWVPGAELLPSGWWREPSCLPLFSFLFLSFLFRIFFNTFYHRVNVKYGVTRSEINSVYRFGGRLEFSSRQPSQAVIIPVTQVLGGPTPSSALCGCPHMQHMHTCTHTHALHVLTHINKSLKRYGP